MKTHNPIVPFTFGGMKRRRAPPMLMNSEKKHPHVGKSADQLAGIPVYDPGRGWPSVLMSFNGVRHVEPGTLTRGMGCQLDRG